jgi:tetratricopeptide (TPR) repeat protein
MQGGAHGGGTPGGSSAKAMHRGGSSQNFHGSFRPGSKNRKGSLTSGHRGSVHLHSAPSAKVLFEQEVVRRHSRGQLKPFIAGYRQTGLRKQQPRRSIQLADVTYSPLLLNNKFFVREQAELYAARCLAQPIQHKKAIFPDLLQVGIYENSLLHEKDGYKIPWDYGLRRGLREYSLGDYKRAVYYFSLMSPLVSCGCTYMLQGIANFHAGDFVQAEGDFTASLENVGEDAYAFFNRGVTRSQLGRIEEAIEDFSQAIYMHPAERRFYVSRALAYRRMGQYKAAERDYSVALQGQVKVAELIRQAPTPQPLTPTGTPAP